MTTIKYGDKIKLVNQYKNPEENAGYLDSNGKLGILGGAQAFGVQTSAHPDRAGMGTATWQVRKYGARLTVQEKKSCTVA